MNKDKYIFYKSNDYALKLIDLYGHKYHSQLFSFIHGLLRESQVRKLNSQILFEMKQFVKESKIVKETIGNIKRSRYKKVIDEDYITDFAEDLNDSTLDDYDWTKIVEKVYLNKKEVYYNLIKKIKEYLMDNIKNCPKHTPFIKNLNKLKDIFKLDDNEVEILSFLFLVKFDADIEDMFKANNIKMDEILKSIRIYCRFFNISPKKLKDYLAKDSKLIKSGLLEKNSRGISISHYVATYLAGISKMDIIDNFFKNYIIENPLKLEDHIVPEKNINSMISLLKSSKGANILLYGKPGTGKTEFAKSLSVHIDYPIYFINQYDEDGEENLSHRKSAIVAAQNILARKSIIVVDECDPIINTQDNMWLCEEPRSKNDSKAWINSLLETTQHKIIWITNKTESIDVSTKRRFSFNQEFKDLTKIQRIKVWETVSKKNNINFLNNDEILELAAKYKVNAGGISLAVEDINSMKTIRNVEDKKLMLENILKQHEKFVFGKISKLVNKTSSYDTGVLNIDVSAEVIFNQLQNFVNYLNENPINPEIQNMNLLFFGPPGTGKTEFVKHLAEQLGKEVLLKRLSDIRSKWYGESLQNIAQMFEEAENTGKILFIDEADSFFVDRESSRNENHLEETNELLTQMENFKGILICSTNLLGSMDQAVLRRFTIKASFGFLTNKGKRRLFKSMFGRFDLDEFQLERLDKIKYLTPGDYKVVKQNHFFNENIHIDTIINDLQKESSLKKVNAKKIGLGGI